MIETLRRSLAPVRTLVADAYDRLQTDPNDIRNLFATTIDNRSTRDNPVLLDQEFFDPKVYEYVDEIQSTGKLDVIQFSVPIAGYNAMIPYNRVNINRPGVVAQLARLTPKLVPAFQLKQTQVLLSVFRLNSLAYDGQAMFSTVHVHPNSMGTYDNILAPVWADIAQPSFDEAKALIHSARARFTVNLAIRSEIIEGQEAVKNLIVIVHNQTHYSIFDQIRTKTEIGLDQNEVVGSFRLLLDMHPTSGEENRIEMVMAEPGGMRPAFLVLDQDPVLEAWEETKFRNDQVAIGLRDGMFGVKPGFPLVALQVRPTT